MFFPYIFLQSIQSQNLLVYLDIEFHILDLINELSFIVL